LLSRYKDAQNLVIIFGFGFVFDVPMFLVIPKDDRCCFFRGRKVIPGLVFAAARFLSIPARSRIPKDHSGPLCLRRHFVPVVIVVGYKSFVILVTVNVKHTGFVKIVSNY